MYGHHHGQQLCGSCHGSGRVRAYCACGCGVSREVSCSSCAGSGNSGGLGSFMSQSPGLGLLGQQSGGYLCGRSSSILDQGSSRSCFGG